MKKLLFLLASVSVLLFVGRFALAAEQIDNFDVVIKINRDSSLNVEERINYNFGDLSRHGIYRDIPVKYKTGRGNYSLRISNISVLNNNKDPYQFKDSVKNGYLHIKIGDPNQYVSGKKLYIIDYTVERAINYFDTYDELYWNATGNEWNIPINWSSVRIILPEKVKEEQIKIKCFAGRIGSTDNCSDSLLLGSGDLKKEISFIQSKLSFREGLTIVVGLPKGILTKPSFLKNALNIIWDNKIIFLPIMVFIILFSLWWKKGRDPKGRGTIVAQYEPPDDLTPIEVGTIIDEKVDKRDISAEIINLAVKGYIKIKHIKKKTLIFSWGNDYLFQKLKEGNHLKNEFEKDLLYYLFKEGKEIEGETNVIEEIKLSKLKNKFYRHFQTLQKKVYENVARNGYFIKNPNKVRAGYSLIGIIVLFSIVFDGGMLHNNLINFVSIIATGILFIIFSFLMPKKTKKGVLAKEQILGLKEYLMIAEKDRIKFHNAPEKNPQQFEKLLPYAMVLGVEKEWAGQFKGIYQNQPSWYEDANMTGFNAILLTNQIGNFSKTANSALYSKPGGGVTGGSGFGGGGFSGGGFGGGGGGSW